MTKKQKRRLFRILTAALLSAVAFFVRLEGWLGLLTYLVPYLVVGYDVLLRALRGIWNRQIFDENFLMAIATVGALVIATSGRGDYPEAVAVMLFYQLGELFQSVAVGKSRRSIGALMELRPDYVNLERGGELARVSPEEVPVGSVTVVRPGERIALDGVVIEGESLLDTAALTGESLPRSVKEGDTVNGGCVNLSGVLRVRTQRELKESTVARILELVESATSRKSRSEAFISKFARVYTPAVCGAALLLALLPPLIRSLVCGLAPEWIEWLYRALTFLVVSCPCAVVISVPLGFFACIGGAGRRGILIKGSNFIETLARVDTVVLDKTGTLTQGQLSVCELHPVGISEAELLRYAACAERFSNHPVARGICRAYGDGACSASADSFCERSGGGVIATVDGRRVAVGNERLMREEGVLLPPKSEAERGSTVSVAVNGVYVGRITLRDRIKPQASKAVQALRAIGVKRTVMLTGDAVQTAREVAPEVGVDSFYAELLPADKVELLEGVIRERRGRGSVAFVGDGINDAPVLSRADVGIAMGGLGSDAAIEAADVVLMDDDPTKVAEAVVLARKCIAIVYQNVIFALGVKLICLLLGALGLADLWLAIFADVGVMVLAVLNATRSLFLGRTRKKDACKEETARRG